MSRFLLPPRRARGRTAVVVSSAALRAALLLVAAAAPAFAAPPSPALHLPEPHADFGQVHQGAIVVHRFSVANHGSSPLTVVAVEPRAEGGWGEAVPPVLPPGGSGEIVVHQPTGDRLGETSYRIRITTDDPAGPISRLSLSGFVESAFEPERPRLEFGTVDRAAGRVLELELFSRDVDRLAIESVIGLPEFLTVGFNRRTGDTGEGVLLLATLRPGAPLGFGAGTFRLRTNVPAQPELVGSWSANVFEDAVPSANPIELGLARVGETLAATVVLRNRSGAPLEIVRVEDPSARVTVSIAPCSPTPGGPPIEDRSCRSLRLQHVPDTNGAVDGDLRVFLTGREPLPLRYTGMAVGAGAQIRNVDLRGVDDEPLVLPSRGAPQPAGTAAGPAAAAVPPRPAPDAPAPAGPAATLRWQAAEENGVYGYLILRAEDRLGPFRRVNRQVVRVPDDGAAAPHAYVYTDTDVRPGKTYHYYLDLVTIGGSKRRFSGVLTKTVPAK